MKKPKITNSNTLAINGGKKAIKKNIPVFNMIGRKELIAAKKVIKTGVLSRFLGTWGEDFYGGPKVLEFEKACEEYFEVKHAISVNSWTSGLITAVGAIGIEPGDEIITSPWTMSASAMAILHWNAIPVFADIEEDTFCLSPKSILEKISSRTKAIIVVDIFGNSAKMREIMEIARQYKLKIISDTAQSPGATYYGRKAGTIADIGGISLNYHKHIHTGEGGVLFTNDKELAMRMKLIRNHAESVVKDTGRVDLNNMVGFNFRLGEIEAAIGIEQLKKLDSIINGNRKIAKDLVRELEGLAGLKLPMELENTSHVFYSFPMIIDLNRIHTPRYKIIQALRAEGIPNLGEGYQNIHLLPIFQKKVAYGSNGFPWILNEYAKNISYSKGICPVAETLHSKSYIGFGISGLKLKEKDVKNIGIAFRKVWANLDSL